MDIKIIWALLIGVSFLLYTILWTVFYRVSVRYIESEIIKEGGVLPSRRALGAIAIHYASVLIFPINRIHMQPFVDGVSARRLSRKKDRVLGASFIVATLLHCIVLAFFYFLYGPGK
ncbi:MAG: hypothetical protein ACI935_000351 [Moritella dasanensis]|jgi:hypothetical protein